MLLTNSVLPNINSEFAVLLMNDQIQQYFVSDAKIYGFVKLFMLQIVQRDRQKTEVLILCSGFANITVIV